MVLTLERLYENNRYHGVADVLKLFRELLTQRVNTFYRLVKFLWKAFQWKKKKSLLLDS